MFVYHSQGSIDDESTCRRNSLLCEGTFKQEKIGSKCSCEDTIAKTGDSVRSLAGQVFWTLPTCQLLPVQLMGDMSYLLANVI